MKRIKELIDAIILLARAVHEVSIALYNEDIVLRDEINILPPRAVAETPKKRGRYPNDYDEKSVTRLVGKKVGCKELREAASRAGVKSFKHGNSHEYIRIADFEKVRKYL